MRRLNDEELNKLYEEFEKSGEENWEKFLNKAIIKDITEELNKVYDEPDIKLALAYVIEQLVEK